jgi:hypothetical protein
MHRPWLTLAVVSLLMLVATPARADELASAVASSRGSGLPIDATVDGFAQAAAERQAAAGAISHSNLNPLLGYCSAVGEVVGRGPDVATIFGLFQNSSSHWSVITSSKWTAMGTGAAYDGSGLLYVAIVFCSVAGAPPPPPPPRPSPPPPPSPAPAPRPEPEAPRFLLTVVGDPEISVVIGVSPAVPMEDWQFYASSPAVI